jgi:riboflavin kinase/FMN adenylyltransferase
MSIRLYRSLEEAAGEFGPCALTIGNFDGVHAGHRKILAEVARVARASGWKAGALTFDPHPAAVVAPERAPKLMTTPEERCELMGEAGIEEALILPFGPEVARLKPEEFAREILAEKLRARAVLVGDNFRFGAKAAGDTALLRALGARLGFEARTVPAVRRRGRIVSSSGIRKLIEEGKVYLAGRLLERPHYIEGEIVQGLGIGSRKTVPTLNVAAEREVIPADGVYVTRASDDTGRRWRAVTNIGNRPTFGGQTRTIETFLLDGLEGETPGWLRVEFLHRLRDERKFPSPEALREQILRDVGRAQSWFRRTVRLGMV